MSLVTIVALVVALLVTLLLAFVVAATARLAGPDRAGAAIQYVIITPFRWLPLTLALGLAWDAGRFAWLGGGSALQGLLVFGLQAAFGAASLVLLCVADGGGAAGPRLARGLVAFLVPLAVIAYLGLEAPLGEGPLRPLLLGALALGVVAALAAAIPQMRASARRTQADRTARSTQEQARYRARLAELRQLSPDAPLPLWWQFTGHNEPGDVRDRALAAVAARPGLHAELAELLSGDWVIEALQYLRWDLHESPAVLAAPVQAALLRVAGTLQRRIEAREPAYAEQFELEVGQAVDLAERFGAYGVDFRPALLATQQALDRITDRQAAPVGRHRLEAWLRQHRVAET